MWKYVSRRVKDTIELGISARKAFSLNHLNNNENQPKQQKNEDFTRNLVLRQQDPSSRDKERRDEKFKRKYNRLHHNQRCFLNALTWSAALVSGFYTSQLLCLYRRNHRVLAETSRCHYSRYLASKTQAVHKNISYLLTQSGQQSLVESVTSFATSCPFTAAKEKSKEIRQFIESKRKVNDEFTDFQHFIDPEYKKYEKYFEPSQTHNVNHEKQKSHTSEYKTDVKEKVIKSQDKIIEETIQQLANIVGELEFQLGVENYRAEKFADAVSHFKLSAGHKHPGGIFNLALCYEQGFGVKKNLKTAKQLYEIASDLGHAKAMYNLGVYHAHAHEYQKAKKLFKQSAELGNAEANKAMKLLKPELPIIDEYEEFLINNSSANKLGAIEQPNLMRIAVT